MTARDDSRPGDGVTGREDAGPDFGRWQPPASSDARSPGIFDALEPGPLRDELTGVKSSLQAPPEPESIEPGARAARLQFTGQGAEYFRIWVVNTLLTIVTLGVYSAWAKVRKTRYFWQNTRLDGHAFDFHGKPKAVLIGRVVALVLLVGYSLAFEFSRRAGLAMIVVLCVVGPWLFARAQRFRLANTSWRGLRFGFSGGMAEAYRVGLPPLAIWFSGTVVAVVANQRVALASLAGLAAVALLPWMHHRLKAWQHARATYGDRSFAFLQATTGFYRTYFVAGALLLGAGAGIALAGVVAFGALLGAMFGRGNSAAVAGVGLLASLAVFFVAALAAWPYFAARLQAIVWSHTRVGDVRFATAIAPWPLGKLVARNVLLTLATAGLYWPFASVALARYRVECMRAESQQPLVAIAASTGKGTQDAAGDAAADAFGVDIGL